MTSGTRCEPSMVEVLARNHGCLEVLPVMYQDLLTLRSLLD
jgi:hypothetical protein